MTGSISGNGSILPQTSGTIVSESTSDGAVAQKFSKGVSAAPAEEPSVFSKSGGSVLPQTSGTIISESTSDGAVAQKLSKPSA